MTDKWQGGKTYVPGSLVIPTASTAVEQLQPANAAFESGDLTSWSTTDATHWTVTNVNPYEGTYSVQVTGSALTQMHSTTTPSIKVGQTVSVSALAEITNSGTDDAHFQVALQWLDASGNFLPGATGVVAGNEINGKGGSWKLSTASGTAPAGAAKFTILLSANPGTHGSTINIDATAYAYAYAPPNPNIVYKATQAGPAKSAVTEPDWPGVVGTPITDGGVTWEGVLATRVVWQASPILQSGGTEPTWPTDPGAVVHDGNIDWITITSQIADKNCPNSKVVAIMASKVFAVDKDIVRFSATVNPLDWTSTQDAGYLPTGLQQANSNDMAVLAPYRSNLTAFNASSFQNWQVDPDPSAMALLDQMDGVGSTYTHAAQPVGNDLYYLSQLGVRSVGIANATTNLQAGDVGMPIDVMVQDAIRVSAVNGNKVLATYYPGAGQYWLAFPGYPADPLLISGNLPDGRSGTNVNYQYNVSGGIGGRTASLFSGSLPAGLSMDAYGLITGTRTTQGAYAWQPGLTDGDGNIASISDASNTTAPYNWTFVQGSANTEQIGRSVVPVADPTRSQVICASDQSVYLCVNGKDWTKTNSPAISQPFAVGATKGAIYEFGSTTAQRSIDNGLTWLPIDIAAENVISSPNCILAMSYTPLAKYSLDDGLTWTSSAIPSSFNPGDSAVPFDGKYIPEWQQWVIPGQGCIYEASGEVPSTIYQSLASTNRVGGVAYSPTLDMVVVAGYEGYSRTRTGSWVSLGSLAGVAVNGICWSPELGLFIAEHGSGIVVSNDGVAWVQQTTNLPGIAGVISCTHLPWIGQIMVMYQSGVGNNSWVSDI